MKWKSFIVLLSIALSLVVPTSLPFLSDYGAMAAIGTLDVCHSAVPALSSNGDMPCVNVLASNLLPLTLLETLQIAIQPCKPRILAFQDERPPKFLLS
jgi:hypothetical protein